MKTLERMALGVIVACLVLAPFAAIAWTWVDSRQAEQDRKRVRVIYARMAYCQALHAQGKRAKFNQEGCNRDSSINR